jgi:hypothetical protein
MEVALIQTNFNKMLLIWVDQALLVLHPHLNNKYLLLNLAINRTNLVVLEELDSLQMLVKEVLAFKCLIQFSCKIIIWTTSNVQMTIIRILSLLIKALVEAKIKILSEQDQWLYLKITINKDLE